MNDKNEIDMIEEVVHILQTSRDIMLEPDGEGCAVLEGLMTAQELLDDIIQNW